MVHPEIENTTPFVAEALHLCDESMRPVVTPVVKATYAISGTGELHLAEEQRPLELAGVHNGEPGESSLRYEPEVAFVKEATDVVLIGHAHATHPGCTELTVGLSAGPIRKSVAVIGDRTWDRGFGGWRLADPQPFERLPLLWERAFGGWDETPGREKNRSYEPRNPVGVGFHARRSRLEAGAPAPNLEDPAKRVTRWGSRPVPAGFGFVGPHWEPRRGLAGTYDETWERTRAPLLPRDFDRRFFNAAPEDQIVPSTSFPADAAVEITHVTPDGALRFRLPGLEAPTALVSRKAGADENLALRLDTVIIDADEMILTLLWRHYTTLRDGPLDVRAIRFDCANAPVREQAPASNVVPLFPEPGPARPAATVTASPGD